MRGSQYTARYEKLLAALREARKEAGLTQTEVARHFDAHPPFISKIESGERRLDVVELAELCRIYGLKLRILLKRAGLE